MIFLASMTFVCFFSFPGLKEGQGHFWLKLNLSLKAVNLVKGRGGGRAAQKKVTHRHTNTCTKSQRD